MNQELDISLENNEATDNKVYFDKSEPGSMFFGPCDEHEIFEIINDLESSKSSNSHIQKR